MQWHTTYVAEIYAKDRQRELRQMANAAHNDAKYANKSRRFNLPKLIRRQNDAPITSTQTMTAVTDAG